ncbi:MAG: hypothetical protein WA705_13705 [Candidatus Ozemobacteraceae bacterium]
MKYLLLRRGQGLIEYAFLIALMAITSIAVLTIAGNIIGVSMVDIISGTLANAERGLGS